MANVSFIAGLYRLVVWRVDANGYAKGQAADPDNIASPASLHSYVITHPISVDAAEPTYEVATDRGGQRIRGQRQLGMSDLGTFGFSVSDYDMTLHALATGSTVDSTYVTGLMQGAPDFNNPDPPQLGMMLIAGAQSRDDSTFGDNEYIMHIFPRVQLRVAQPSVQQGGGENPNPLNFTVTPSLAQRLPNGVPFSALNTNYTNDENMVHTLIAPYQYGISTFVDDGSGGTLQLPYLPLYNTVTLGTARNWTTLNGESSAVTSIDTGTGAVVVPAGSDGDITVVMYPTAYEAV